MLTDTDLAVLQFESRHWRYAGAKEQAIRETLGLTAVAYYQRLNRLVDDAEAERVAPVLIHRLRRMRDANLRRRSTRRLAG